MRRGGQELWRVMMMMVMIGVDVGIESVQVVDMFETIPNDLNHIHVLGDWWKMVIL